MNSSANMLNDPLIYKLAEDIDGEFALLTQIFCYTLKAFRQLKI